MSSALEKSPRRRALAGVVLLLVLSGITTSREIGICQPNFLILVLDTLRADHLGLYGYGRPTSPTLDSLAGTSVVFDHAVAQGAATYVSHRSLFHSRLPSQVGSDRPTLAAILRTAGYQTAGFTDGGQMSGSLGFARGFDHWEEFGGGLRQSLPRVEAWLVGEARAPWYAFLHTYDIHLPYAPPPPYDSIFFPEYEGPVVPQRTREICRKIRHLFEYSAFQGEVQLTAADRRKMVALYDGGIRYADTLVGQLLRLLESRGLLDDTVLIVLSDHGEEFWDHGSVLHGHTVYHELLHVPLIVRLPGGRGGGRRVSETVRLLDVAPTVLRLAGLPPPRTFQGQSLTAELGGRVFPDRPAVSEMGTLKSRVEMPWKLILDTEQPRPALFNLAWDPHEQFNLVAQQADRTMALLSSLRESLPRQMANVPILPAGDVPPHVREQLKALGYVE
jgi:arylsulfatase A-like enzyme